MLLSTILPSSLSSQSGCLVFLFPCHFHPCLVCRELEGDATSLEEMTLERRGSLTSINSNATTATTDSSSSGSGGQKVSLVMCFVSVCPFAWAVLLTCECGGHVFCLQPIWDCVHVYFTRVGGGGLWSWSDSVCVHACACTSVCVCVYACVCVCERHGTFQRF